MSKKTAIKPTPGEKQEQTWENPKNPEKPKDKRDAEQLIRQKKEAERRKDNLSDEPKESDS